MRGDGTHKHRVVRAGNMDAWGPNGGRLLVDRPGGDTFGVFSLKNQTVRWFPNRKMGLPGGASAWDWSWRTNRIVFTGYRDSSGNNNDLYSVSPDFTGLQQVTHTPRSDEFGARWAPVGKRRLAYTASIYRAPQCDDRLRVLRLADKTRTKLGCNGAASNAAWSPDGRQLLFARRSPDSRLGAQDTTCEVAARPLLSGTHAPSVIQINPIGGLLAEATDRRVTDDRSHGREFSWLAGSVVVCQRCCAVSPLARGFAAICGWRAKRRACAARRGPW